MQRQNLGERNILYVSSSALWRFISPKSIKRVSCILSLSASTSCHFIISLSKPTSTGSLRALTRFSLPLSVCILYPSFSFLVLSVYSFVTNFHPHTHSETVCVVTFFHVRICCWASLFSSCRKSISLLCLQFIEIMLYK